MAFAVPNLELSIQVRQLRRFQKYKFVNSEGGKSNYSLDSLPSGIIVYS